jgi:GNAT superfamily N-acetyltransferase
MNQSAKIRRALPEECELLSEIAMRSKAHWGYSAEFMEACRAELSYTPADLEQHDFFVATHGKIIAGFHALIRLSESKLELEALFLKPEFIGQGLGRMLFEHALKTAKATGAQEMMIQGDPNAKDFYLKVGAKLIDEKESGSIPGRFLPLFSIDLTAI